MAGELPFGAPVPGSEKPPVPQDAGPTEPVAPSTPPEGTGSTADIEARIAEIEAEHKRNISRLQSSLMGQQSERERRWEQEKREYEDQISQAFMSSMDEKERGEYERDLLRNRVSQMEERINEERAAREAYANMNTYAQWFTSMGVKAENLDWSTPEALAQSGTDALTKHVQSLNERLAQMDKAPAAPATPAPAGTPQPRPPVTPVVTSNSGTPSTAATFEDIRKGLSEQAGRQLTDEDVFKLAERNPHVREKLTELARVEAERIALQRGT